MRILFISHAYPPTVGGVENQNYELSMWLSKRADIKILANKRGKKYLPIFMSRVLLESLFLFRKYDVVLLGNALLAHIGWVLKVTHRKPVISIAHGLDLTFNNWFYQFFWVGFFIKMLDKLIFVGNETLRVAEGKGINKEKLVFIPNGLDIKKYAGTFFRTDLEKILKMDLKEKCIILTSGRLVKRKGVAWFIRNVMPQIPEHIIYVVAGEGADKKNIENAIREQRLFNRVKLLGYITDAERDLLFHTCDVFVQPNIKVDHDIEGFGISVIEAAFCGIPVIASRLEGLQDAIKDGMNGFLLEPCDIQAWVIKINEILTIPNFRNSFGEKARQFIIENYRWEKISQEYLQEIEKVLKRN